MGEQITSSLELKEVIKRLYAEVSQIMDATGFIIYMLDKDKDCLRVKHVFGKHKGVVHEIIPMSSEESFCVFSIRNKSEVFMNDVKKDHALYLKNYYWKNVPDDEIIHSFINIPLIARGEAFGVVSVQSFNRNAYNQSDLEVLRSLAVYMSIAFNNATTYAMLDKARKDIAEKKKEIEEKNEDILGSIRYARRIQESLLPTERYVEKMLNRLLRNSGVNSPSSRLRSD